MSRARRTPSGVGAARLREERARWSARITQLEVVWHRAVTPGYGWIFPCPGGVFNIGVGIADSHNAKASDGKLAKREVNLREVMDDFKRVYAPAREADARRQGTGWASSGTR